MPSNRISLDDLDRPSCLSIFFQAFFLWPLCEGNDFLSILSIYCLCPKLLIAICILHYTPSLFNNCSICSFCITILFWHVRNCKLMSDALWFEIYFKLFVYVLSPLSRRLHFKYITDHRFRYAKTISFLYTRPSTSSNFSFSLNSRSFAIFFNFFLLSWSCLNSNCLSIGNTFIYNIYRLSASTCVMRLPDLCKTLNL